MIGKLIGYELLKKWKFMKYVLGAFIILEALLLIINRVFFWDNTIAKAFLNSKAQQHLSASFGITMLIYFLSAVFLFVYPFLEGIYHYEKDLSGKQAVLELMLPAPSWKKILSKLTATVCSTIVCVLLALGSIIAFIIISANFDRIILEKILEAVFKMITSPLESIYVSLNIIFGFASFYMIIFLCIAFAKSITHKNTIAVPISIGVLIACITIQTLLGDQADKFPILQFNFLGITSSLSSIILQILVLIAAFFGTSWLMENKIEN